MKPLSPTLAAPLPRRAAARAALCLLAGASSAAFAQSSPYYVGVSQALSYESNIARLADGVQPSALPTAVLKKRADTVSSTTLIAGFDQPVSRQRLRGSVRLSANRYMSNSGLDNESYVANLGMDWETVNRLSGVVDVSSQRNLRKPDPNEASQLGRADRNLETVNQINLLGRIGGTTRLSAQAGVLWRQVDYSSSLYSTAEYDQTTWSAGVFYRPSSMLQLGTALRTGNTRYNRAGDDRRRHDLDFTVDWAPSGDLTRVYGRLSYTNVDSSLASAPDYRGLSGDAQIRWRVTGKTTLTGRVSHDTGQDSSYLGLAGSNLTLLSTDYSRTTTGLYLSADHALTGKVQLSARLGLAHRELSNSQYGLLAGQGGFSGSDLTTTLGVGARWQPTRTLQFGCDLSHERRTSSVSVSGSVPYSNNGLSCYGQLTLDRL